MKGIKRTSLFLLLAAFLFLPYTMFAQGGITVPESDSPAPAAATEQKGGLDIMKQLRSLWSFIDDAEEAATDGAAAAQDFQEQAEESGWAAVAAKAWEALKSYFSDKGVQELLLDTLKLFLRLAVNIFTLIAGVITKLLEVLQ